jgi:hypothetical protein
MFKFNYKITAYKQEFFLDVLSFVDATPKTLVVVVVDQFGRRLSSTMPLFGTAKPPDPKEQASVGCRATSAR